MKIRKIVAALLITLLASGAVFANNNGEAGSEKTKITVFAFGDDTTPEGQSFTELIEKFIAENPDIEVEYDMMFDELFHNRQQAMLAAGEKLDVTITWDGGSRHTKMTDAGQHIDQAQFVDASAFKPGALNLKGMNEGLYAVPESVGVHTVMYANQALLAELGLSVAKTYEELVEQDAVARAAGKRAVAYPGATAWCHDTFLFSVIAGRFAGADGVVALQQNRAKFTDAPFVKTFEMVEKMFADGILDEATLQADYDAHLAEFNQGDALYMIDGGWRAAQVTIDPSEFTWEVFPALPGEVISNSSNGGFSSYGWAITKSATEDPAVLEASKKLLSYLTGEHAMRVRARIQGSVPALDIDNVEFKPGTEAQGAYISSLDHVTNTVGDLLDASIKDPYMNGIIEIGLGAKTPAQVAEETQAVADEFWGN